MHKIYSALKGFRFCKNISDSTVHRNVCSSGVADDYNCNIGDGYGDGNGYGFSPIDNCKDHYGAGNGSGFSPDSIFCYGFRFIDEFGVFNITGGYNILDQPLNLILEEADA